MATYTLRIAVEFTQDSRECLEVPSKASDGYHREATDLFDILDCLDHSLGGLLNFACITDGDGDALTIIGVTDAQALRHDLSVEEFIKSTLASLQETDYMRFPDCNVRLYVTSCMLDRFDDSESDTDRQSEMDSEGL